ncbi:MAG: LeucinetRNA ligase [Candidatus Saccharibacteria bacterium]|nr:LeucinetRNA ligase [Candidatus Saccharibacteria bacterium]
MKRYNPSEIEPKWQAVWDEQQVNHVDADHQRQKLYVSGMFPYPSGAGMHTGHAFSYSIVDAIARFHRQHGMNVLNPMGWDTFGLPAENYAIKTGTQPAAATEINIANFKKQFKRMGVSIDWHREINTTDPEYYRWTQWVFTKLFERGLAYQKESLQWWCPVDKTVLANEQVEGGHCWRCGSLVEKKSMKQWFFKITEYADALLDEIEDLDWPQKIKTAQTNWIGKSQGAEIEFSLSENGAADVSSNATSISVFSTRPDTIFGATFLVIAPEHPLVTSLTTDEMRESVESYVKDAVKKSEIDRMNDTKEKTGVFTGSYAVNPATGENIPVWVADYVLTGYGTGAIMAVPAHDERDYAFAEKFKLPIINVINPSFGEPQGDETHKVGVNIALRDPKTDKVVVLDWGPRRERSGGMMLIGGGVDNDEDIVECAIREIAEETGYTDVQLVARSEAIGRGYFYSNVKDKNYSIDAHGLYFELVSDKQEDTNLDEGEKEKFTVTWQPTDKVAAMLDDGIHRYFFETLVEGKSYHGEGLLVNSGAFNGMSTSDAREEIVDWLEQQGTGRSMITYKMRDWLISRQRYWGAPIPIIHCEEHGAVPVPDDQLPVVLPVVEDFAPKGDGKSVLGRVEEWVNTTCPTCGGPAKRETDTMDGYACSSWYLLRYADPHNDVQAWDPEKANYWAPVDYYVGGDHAVAHLLYVRFWTHVFHDMGLTQFKEPVKKLVYHGYINAEDGTKMSKSKGNVIDPLDIIDQGYGADALRTYVLFMGPIELDAAWDSRGIAGVYRFLNRVWTLTQQYLDADKNQTKNDEAVKVAMHRATKKATDDYRRLSFNTAIAALMEYTNELYKYKIDGYSDTVWREALSRLVQLVAPVAPHIAEELWHQLGHDSFIQNAPWPTWDDALTENESITIAVQVNGKLRGEVTLEKDASEDDIKAAALSHENVAKFLDNKEPTKIIYIRGRLVSIVV